MGTCLADMLYAEAGMAGIRLLEREGVKVIYPRDQTCCGQPALNSGFQEEALEVALHQIHCFPKAYPHRGSIRILWCNDGPALS